MFVFVNHMCVCVSVWFLYICFYLVHFFCSFTMRCPIILTDWHFLHYFAFLSRCCWLCNLGMFIALFSALFEMFIFSRPPGACELFKFFTYYKKITFAKKRRKKRKKKNHFFYSNFSCSWRRFNFFSFSQFSLLIFYLFIFRYSAH